MRNISLHIAKATGVALSALLMLAFVLTWLLSVPEVQAWAVHRGVALLEAELHSEVELEAVEFALPAMASLRGLRAYDLQGQPFLQLEELRVGMLNFSFWRYLFGGREGRQLRIGSLRLRAPDIQLSRSASGQLNIQYLLDYFGGGGGGGDPFRLDITSLRIERGRFRYADSSDQRVLLPPEAHVNYRNLDVDSLRLDVSLRIEGERWADVQLAQLSAVERRSGLRLDHLSFELLADSSDAEGGTCEPFVQIEDLSLQSARSWLLGSARFPGKSLATLFKGQGLRYEAFLKENSRLDFALFKHFLTRPLPLAGEVYLQGQVSGGRNWIESPDMQVAYGEETRIRAAVRIDSMLDNRRAQMRLSMKPSSVSIRELQALLPGTELPGFLLPLSGLRLTGEWDGGFYDFGVQVAMNSEQGALSANARIAMPPASPRLRYQGSFSTEHLNVNAFWKGEDAPSQDLNLSATVIGEGESLDSLLLGARLALRPSDLFGIRFDSAYGEADIRREEMGGSLYASLDGGSFDLKAGSAPGGRYRAQGSLRSLPLHRFLPSSEALRASGQLGLDFRGDSLENLNGELELADLALERPAGGQRLSLPRLRLSATGNSFRNRYLALQSSLLDADLAGEFTYRQSISLFRRLLKETELYFLNNDSLSRAYYAAKVPDSTDLELKFGLAPRDSFNALLRFLDLPGWMAPGSLLTGELAFAMAGPLSSEQIELRLDSDSLAYGGSSLGDVEADLTLIKYADSLTLNLTGGISADRGHAGSYRVEQLSLNFDGSSDQFEIDFQASQRDLPARVVLQLDTRVVPGWGIRSSFNPASSKIYVQGDTLRLSEGDSILYSQGVLEIQNLIFQDDERYLRAHGVISEQPEDELLLSLARLDLGNLTRFLSGDYRLDGKLNADVRLRNLFHAPEIDVLSRTDEFSVNEFAYGSIYLSGGWKSASQEARLRARLLGQGDTTLILAGSYALDGREKPLDFRLTTWRDFPLDQITPFVEGELYDISGAVELREFSITGSWEDLAVNGIGRFKRAGFGVDYFKTAYQFEGDIFFDNSRITFPRITLYDKNRNHADFHGVIRHKGLRAFEFDLQLDRVRDFLVMETQKKDNELFYGSVFLKDGIADITGTLDRIEVQAIVATGSGTRLRIPLSDYSALERPDYIRFEGESKAAASPAGGGLEGFTLALTLLVTEEAETELIFNERTGDIIKGRGNGAITMTVDETGEFTMQGDYEISRGNYLFTSQNVINKKFELKPGGKISWDGDPYQARLNLEAYYPLTADISALIQSNQPVRTPVQVLMRMEGLLLQPDISLGIELPSLTQQNASQIASYLKTIAYDEQELNKQVFSLMVFNRFAPLGGLGSEIASPGVVTTSISELLSNQFNYWLSQATNDKLNVNVNTNNFQDVSLLVSARLFNDRVTVERNGMLVGPNSTLSVGNISIIIRLLPTPEQLQQGQSYQRELVLEVFNRESFNDAQDLGLTSYRTGAGIYFKRDFDHLADLFRRDTVLNPKEPAK